MGEVVQILVIATLGAVGVVLLVSWWSDNNDRRR